MILRKIRQIRTIIKIAFRCRAKTCIDQFSLCGKLISIIFYHRLRNDLH